MTRRREIEQRGNASGSRLPALPCGWAHVRSGDLFSFVTSGSRGWAQYYNETGPRFLRVGNLKHDTIELDLDDIQRVQPPGGPELDRTRVKAGDLLVSITADVGMVGLVPEGFEVAYVNQHVAIARPVENIENKFLGWYLASRTGGQRQFKDLQRGATKAGLGLDDIRSVVVPFPPIKEQARIVAAIETNLTRLDAGVANLERVRAKLKRYRAAVLKAACEGRLVPTEAELARAEGRTYEPADRLLARILTQRRERWEADQHAAFEAQGKRPTNDNWGSSGGSARRG